MDDDGGGGNGEDEWMMRETASFIHCHVAMQVREAPVTAAFSV